jgi:hypothetical protein
MPRRTFALRGLWWYLGALTAPRIVLWCYLIWWAFTAHRYFDPNPRLWLTSLGLSAIIGTGLYLSTALGGKTVTRLDPFQIARLYLMPFCVSSFAALIKDRGFFLVFHPTVDANVLGVELCWGFVAVTLFARFTTRGRAV